MFLISILSNLMACVDSAYSMLMHLSGNRVLLKGGRVTIQTNDEFAFLYPKMLRYIQFLEKEGKHSWKGKVYLDSPSR